MNKRTTWTFVLAPFAAPDFEAIRREVYIVGYREWYDDLAISLEALDNRATRMMVKPYRLWLAEAGIPRHRWKCTTNFGDFLPVRESTKDNPRNIHFEFARTVDAVHFKLRWVG